MAPRNKISERNPYHLSTHRFLELKHYCLQVPEWEKKIFELSLSIGMSSTSAIDLYFDTKRNKGPKIECWNIICDIYELETKVNQINLLAIKIDVQLGDYLYKAVTLGYSYEYLQTHYNIPLSRATWYREYYRKFFWALDKVLRKE